MRLKNFCLVNEQKNRNPSKRNLKRRLGKKLKSTWISKRFQNWVKLKFLPLRRKKQTQLKLLLKNSKYLNPVLIKFLSMKNHRSMKLKKVCLVNQQKNRNPTKRNLKRRLGKKLKSTWISKRFQNWVKLKFLPLRRKKQTQLKLLLKNSQYLNLVLIKYPSMGNHRSMKLKNFCLINQQKNRNQ